MTLIELLAVMAIMMMMAVIALASYFGATRGAAMKGAVSHLQDTLSLARQTAIMHRREAHVLFADEGVVPEYVIVMHEGTGNGGGKTLSIDKYANRAGLVTGGKIYNLNTGRSTTIEQVHDASVDTADSIWTGTCEYGWEVGQPIGVPKEFGLEDRDVGACPFSVVFNADGTTRPEGYQINITELQGTRGHGEVKVAGLTGFSSGSIVAN